MKMREVFGLILFATNTFVGWVEAKSLDEIMAQANEQEKNNLGQLLTQVRVVPAKDSSGNVILEQGTGKPLFKVLAIEKGSVYDREGLRVGDLVSGGSIYQSEPVMKLKKTNL